MKYIFNRSRTNNQIGFFLTSSEYQNFALTATRCVPQSGTALFGEDYAMFYFDAKHLAKGLNTMW